MSTAALENFSQETTEARTDLVGRFGPVLALPVIAIGAVGATSVIPGSVCASQICFGHACPGCGMTRAIASAARGEFGLSWRYHPLAILVVLQLGWFALVRLGVVAKASPKTMQRLIRANVVVFLVVWVLRWRFGLLDFVVT